MTTAPGSLSDRALELARLTLVRRIITAGAVVASALLQAFLIQAFVNPANLLPSETSLVIITGITIRRKARWYVGGGTRTCYSPIG